MKHYKYSAILLAAMTCGAVWASVDALTDGKKGDSEKVKPSENFVAQSRKAPVVRYTKTVSYTHLTLPTIRLV